MKCKNRNVRYLKTQIGKHSNKTKQKKYNKTIKNTTILTKTNQKYTKNIAINLKIQTKKQHNTSENTTANQIQI